MCKCNRFRQFPHSTLLLRWSVGGAMLSRQTPAYKATSPARGGMSVTEEERVTQICYWGGQQPITALKEKFRNLD
jgi:hypothetical protein